MTEMTEMTHKQRAFRFYLALAEHSNVKCDMELIVEFQKYLDSNSYQTSDVVEALLNYFSFHGARLIEPDNAVLCDPDNE